MIDASLVTVDIDKDALEKIIVKNIQAHLNNIDNEKIFYTMDNLQNITGMSKGFIEQRFFHDSRFVKLRRKVGRKWLFPVKETRDFLNKWIIEQPND